MLRSESSGLYMGQSLNELDGPKQLSRVFGGVQRVPVEVSKAAKMFHLNIQSWKNQPFIRGNYKESDIEDLQHRLRCLTSNEDITGEIEWRMRQIAFQKCRLG